MARRTRYWAEIQAAAKAHRLDPILVEAIVVQESDGNTDGFRFERQFFNRLLKGKPEWDGLNPRRISSSYGLMQCMFVVAVERGYDRTKPPEGLFVPEVGIEFGCRHVRYLMDWADTFDAPAPVKLSAVLAAYNGGRGGNRPTDVPLRSGVYAASVLRHYAALKAEHGQ